MITLYHAPMSRSTRLVQLVHELGAEDAVTIRQVQVVRHDGSGSADPANPHPEGKVPMLVHDGVEIWESTAIAQYLAELFPESGLGVPPGDPMRGRYLSWLAWYGDVLEPLVVFKTLGIEHPGLARTFRGMAEATRRLRTALETAPYLCGERYTVADLIVASTFSWQAALTPEVPAIQDWVARCRDRPAAKRAFADDSKAIAD
ncbi:glutathione S-transferase family protein [Frigidibacter sp. ROC022]|uniref:glutathione S-transferase family protein n=1 Tax=Frigidibacter sp. ROC022 TaxID=2971796 RepID=UPI00215B375D|nr:glutathione S-transferase family protein [Frigidibacter sp. ROC022]MCR8724752.1 glutathione S-transferase family protein [Frigidibacter sp. ROC022]